MYCIRITNMPENEEERVKKILEDLFGDQADTYTIYSRMINGKVFNSFEMYCNSKNKKLEVPIITWKYSNLIKVLG